MLGWLWTAIRSLIVVAIGAFFIIGFAVLLVEGAKLASSPADMRQSLECEGFTVYITEPDPGRYDVLVLEEGAYRVVLQKHADEIGRLLACSGYGFTIELKNSLGKMASERIPLVWVRPLSEPTSAGF